MLKVKQRANGFTLIELMITVVVLAIFAAVALPNLSDFIEKRRLIRLAEQVQDTMISAKLEAIKQSREVFFRFCPPTDESTNWRLGYTIDNNQNCDSENDFIGQISSRNADSDTDNYPKVTFALATFLDGEDEDASFTPNSLTFSPLGTLPNNSIEMPQPTFETEDGRWQLSIQTNLIGRVRICSPSINTSPGRYSLCTD